MGKKKRKLSHQALEKQLRSVFISDQDTIFTINQLKDILLLSNSKGSVRSVLDKLINEKYLFEVQEGHYRLDKYVENKATRTHSSEKDKKNIHTVIGIIDRTKTGTAYLVTEDDDQEDIHISRKNLHWALHGDTVRLRILKTTKYKPEGEVLKILQRRTHQFIGQLSKYKNQSEVRVDDGKSSFDILINNAQLKGAQHKEMVLVEVTDWPRRNNQSPMGIVLEKLGDENTNEIEMRSILLKYGFDNEFPTTVIKEAEKLSDQIQESEYHTRRDFREVTTFTIDPESARDFDDALSLKIEEDGSYEVGVHIADVSHYVKEGSALDKEALKRSTSVYLVDRVSPMLPEKLSNDLCSLRPQEERRAFSAVMAFDASHKLKGSWFGRTIIKSDRRFTYREAQDRIDGEGDFMKEIRFLHEVSSRLRKKRFNEGSINFETDEVAFVLDAQGKPVDVYVKERLEAHSLIEELMLLANQEVATYIHNKGKKAAAIPFIYRVHDEPDMDKVREFTLFAKELGVKLDIQRPAQIPAAFNHLTNKIQDKELVNILQPLAIRTMAKAEYSPENIGHFGLGFQYYTHFTSPIRRYSDVLVHRILFKNLESDYRIDEKWLKEMAQHISAQERNAMDAERESVKYKQAEFLQNSIGKTFRGVVSGMIDRGFFVELVDSLAEGLVDWSSLRERYVLSDNRLKAVSRESGKTIAMGTKVMVRIDAVNVGRREVDMSLVELV